MRSEEWDRTAVIESLREDVWRHLTRAARTDDEVALEAARLLQMPTDAVRTLAQVHFVLSPEVGELLAQMPTLIRRLSTTTMHEREQSAERVRGSVRWSETFAARATSGLPHLHVTNPTRRAYDTPENEMLAFALDAIARFGRLTDWERSTGPGAGGRVRERINQATRWGRARALGDLPLVAPTDGAIARVRASRRRRTYQAVLDTVRVYRELVARLDRNAIRSAVEDHALVTRDNAVLLELLAVFRTMRSLEELGWRGEQAPLIRGGPIFSAGRSERTLDLYYQVPPAEFRAGSPYTEIQRAHGFRRRGWLRPDLILRVSGVDDSPRWLMLEVKGVGRSVAKYARSAARDLLAYRRAFNPALTGQPGAYGIGVAWGAELKPAPQAEILLCSPDTLSDALAMALEG